MNVGLNTASHYSAINKEGYPPNRQMHFSADSKKSQNSNSENREKLLVYSAIALILPVLMSGMVLAEEGVKDFKDFWKKMNLKTYAAMVGAAGAVLGAIYLTEPLVESENPQTELRKRTLRGAIIGLASGAPILKLFEWTGMPRKNKLTTRHYVGVSIAAGAVGALAALTKPTKYKALKSKIAEDKKA